VHGRLPSPQHALRNNAQRQNPVNLNSVCKHLGLRLAQNRSALQPALRRSVAPLVVEIVAEEDTEAVDTEDGKRLIQKRLALCASLFLCPVLLRTVQQRREASTILIDI
jgi:hypothetical protein